MAGSGRKVWAADEVLAAADLQDYIQDQVVFVYNSASARTSGILAPSEGMVSYLKDTNLLYVFDGSSWIEIAPNVGTAGTYTKVTTDAKGRVTSGTTLSASDVPDLDSAKITSGTLGIDRIPTIPSSKLGTGNWNMGVSTLTTVNVTASGVVSAGDFSSGGTLTANGGIASSDVYNRNLSGPYKAVWVDSTGRLGNTSSTIRVKQDVVDSGLSADAAKQLRLREFRYIADVEKDADAPTYIGLIAEELLEIPGMEKFVFFDELEDGSRRPAGIHYEWLALSLIPLVQSLSDRMDSVESRLNDLEGK